MRRHARAKPMDPSDQLKKQGWTKAGPIAFPRLVRWGAGDRPPQAIGGQGPDCSDSAANPLTPEPGRVLKFVNQLYNWD